MFQLVFIAHDVIERFILPQMSGASGGRVDGVSGEGFPRVQDVGEPMLHERTHEDMDVVGHDHVAAEPVAFAVEMAERGFDDGREVRILQQARTEVFIQRFLQLLAIEFMEFRLPFGIEG